MTVNPGDIKPPLGRRVFAWLTRYVGWVCVLLLGLGMVWFFQARSDLLTCSTAFADENNRVQSIRSDAAVENSEALSRIVTSTIPFLDPEGHPTAQDRIDLYNAYRNFATVNPDYQKIVRENPVPQYETFCGNAERHDS